MRLAHLPSALHIRPLVNGSTTIPRRQGHVQLQLLEVRVQPRRLPDVLLVGVHHAGELQHAEVAKETQGGQFLDGRLGWRSLFRGVVNVVIIVVVVVVRFLAEVNRPKHVQSQGPSILRDSIPLVPTAETQDRINGGGLIRWDQDRGGRASDPLRGLVSPQEAHSVEGSAQ